MSPLRHISISMGVGHILTQVEIFLTPYFAHAKRSDSSNQAFSILFLVISLYSENFVYIPRAVLDMIFFSIFLCARFRTSS